jgi:hypothetical protein
MSEDQHRFLMLLRQLPARLTAEQAAWLLNCQPHDIPVLVAARLLKPLANPPPNGVKFFSTPDLVELIKDRAFLVKITNAVNQHWHSMNQNRKSRPLKSSQGGQVPGSPSAQAFTVAR